MASKSAVAFPTKLTYGTPNNLMSVLKEIQIIVMSTFGIDGDFVVTMKYREYRAESEAELKKKFFKADEEVPAEDLKLLRTESLKKALSAAAACDNIKVQVFWAIRAILSDAGVNAIQRLPNAKDSFDSFDALWLLKSVMSVHYPGAEHLSDGERQFSVHKALSTLTQDPNEDVHQFTERILFYRACHTAMGCDPVSESWVVELFLAGLDPWFDEWKKKVRRDIQNGVFKKGNVNVTLVQVSESANNEPFNRLTKQPADNSVFATKNKNQSKKPDLSTTLSKEEEQDLTVKLSPAKWRALTKEQQQLRRVARAAVTVKLGGVRVSDSSRSQVSTGKNDSILAAIEKAVHKIDLIEKRVRGLEEPKQSKVNWTVVNDSDEEYDDFMVQQTALMSNGNKAMKNYKIHLDTAANISIVQQDLLSAIQPTTNPLNITGVGGVTLKAKHQGLLHNFFPCYTAPDATANVLSFAAVRDKYPTTRYDGEKDEFIVPINAKMSLF